MPEDTHPQHIQQRQAWVAIWQLKFILIIIGRGRAIGKLLSIGKQSIIWMGCSKFSRKWKWRGAPGYRETAPGRSANCWVKNLSSGRTQERWRTGPAQRVALRLSMGLQVHNPIRMA